MTNNALDDELLEKRLDALCKSNWIMEGATSKLKGSARDKINNWYKETRGVLLSMLCIYEDPEYKGVYHNSLFKKKD